MAQPTLSGQRKRIVIVGAGFGGAYAAKALKKHLPKEHEVTVIDRNNFLTFYPLVIEAGVGNLEPRHVVVPIRRLLGKAEFILGEVTEIDTASQKIRYQVLGGDEAESIRYDHLILAPGSVTKLAPVPGLKEFGFEIKSLADSIEMRDRAIRTLELANTVTDQELRREILRVVVVGSNFTGIEFAGEYQDFLIDCSRTYKNVQKDDIQVYMLEMAKRILPALDEDLADYARRHLADRGLDIRTQTTVKEMTARAATLSTGEVVRTRTVVWAAGVAPPPLLDRISGLPRNKQGYIDCEPTLLVKGFQNVWALGDCATVIAADGKPYAATAQNATRQGPALAKNLVRMMRNEPLQDFRFNPLGSLAALGDRTAVAKVFGIKTSGFIAYFLFRSTYLAKMPTLSRKVRVFLDWFLDIFFRRDPVQLGMRNPPPRELKSEQERDVGGAQSKAKLM